MDKTARIAELSGRVNDLTLDELTELKGLVTGRAKELNKDESDEATVELNGLADTLDLVAERQTAIKAEQAQKAQARKDAADRIAKINASDEEAAGEGETTEGEESEDGEADADADKGGEGAEADAGVLVATGKGKKTVYRSGPSKMGQKPLKTNTETEQRTSLVAAANVPGIAMGTEFDGRMGLAKVMAKQLGRMDRRSSNGRVLLATADWSNQFPAERRLVDGDMAGNIEKIDALCHPAVRRAITASGGVPQPVNVDYDLKSFAEATRPFRDGIDQYQCDRGGLTYRLPPTLADLIPATSIWTAETDADPGESTKPVYTVVIADAITTLVNAVPTRLQFGNLLGQFDPETVAVNTDLAMSAAARVAEIELLTLLQAVCVANVTSAQVLGAARDWFSTIEQVCANYRYTNRIPMSQNLVIVVPEFVKGMIRQDRLMELAHDSAGMDVFMLDDKWITDALAVRGIKAIWTLDGIPAVSDVYPFQGFTGVVTGDPVPDWPASIVWNIYVDGMIQHLDSGQLNLGVVRDATLDATNDYETFVEIFEGLAFRGFASGAWQINSVLVPSGASSATVTVS